MRRRAEGLVVLALLGVRDAAEVIGQGVLRVVAEGGAEVGDDLLVVQGVAQDRQLVPVRVDDEDTAADQDALGVGLQVGDLPLDPPPGTARPG